MLIAIPSTEGYVGGPGECDEVLIFDSEKDYELTESYHNPALEILSPRGITMLVSALRLKVSAVIVAHLGSPTFHFIKGKAKLYIAEGMKAIEAIASLREGKLQEMLRYKTE